MKRKSILVLAGTVLLVAIVFLLYFFTKTSDALPVAAGKDRPAPQVRPTSLSAPSRIQNKIKPPLEAGPGIIRGAVFDLEGRPVGADVLVNPMPSSTGSYDVQHRKALTATCDEEGRFEVGKLPHGVFAVFARWEDTSALQRVVLRPNQDVVEIVLVLYPGGVLAGVVVDKGGEPISGARLTPLIHDGEAVSPGITGPLDVLSSDDGGFVFSALHPHTWELRVSAKGYASILSSPLAVGTTDNVIILSPAISLPGTVRRAVDEAPVAGVLVLAAMKNVREINERAETDGTGAFTLSSLGEGRHTVDVVSDSLVLENGPIEFSIEPSADPPPLDLHVLDGGVVRGRIADGATGEGISGATLRARPKNKASRMLETTSRDDGKFEFAGLSRCEYTISPFGLSSYPRSETQRKNATVSVQPGDVVDGVEVLVFRGPVVSGIVLDTEDKPVPSATVDINVKQIGFSTQIKTDNDGTFAFADFDGERDLLLRASSLHGSSPPIEIHVPSDGVSGLVLRLNDQPTGSIAGTVVDKQGNPVQVELSAHGANSDTNQFAFVKTSDGGQFFVRGLVADEYTISARWKSVSSSEIAIVTVSPGQEIRNLRLAMPFDMRTISGKVIDTAGNPVTAALQFWLVAENSSMPWSFAKSRHDGAFVAKGMPEGMYEIRVTSQGYESQNLQAKAGDDNIVITMLETAQLQGRVIDAETRKPVTSFEVAVIRTTSQPGELPATEKFITVSDPEGRFSVPADAYFKLIVRARGYQLARVKAESSAELIVPLQPGDVKVQGRVLDAGGMGRAGVPVFVGALSQQTQYRTSEAATRSGEDGTFEIQGLASGSIVLSAFDPVLGSGSATGQISPGNSGPINIQLHPGATIRGAISLNGTAVEQATVTLTDGLGVTFRKAGDADGQFTFDNVAAGHIAVSVELDNANSERKQIDLEPGEEAFVDFDLGPTPK